MAISNTERQRRHKQLTKMKAAAFDKMQARIERARAWRDPVTGPQLLYIFEDELGKAMHELRAQRTINAQDNGL